MPVDAGKPKCPKDVSGASRSGSVHIFDEGPFARQQIRGSLKRLAWSLRATLHSIKLPVRHKKPAIDDDVRERHKIVVTKQSRFDFDPSTRVERIASIQYCSMAIERDGLVGLAGFIEERGPIMVRRVGQQMNRITGTRKPNRRRKAFHRMFVSVRRIVTLNRIDMQIICNAVRDEERDGHHHPEQRTHSGFSAPRRERKT